MRIELRKHTRYLFISVCIAALLLAGLYFSGMLEFRPGQQLPPRLVHASKGLNQYEIQAEFNPDAKTLICRQKVEYINRSEDQLTHLYFHLYPNAYRYEDKPVFEKNEMKRAYPNGFSPGHLELDQVLINGVQADFVVGGYSDNVLMLILKKNLDPRHKAVIEMDYTVVLPNCLGRFGYGDNMYKAVNWYPIASVYDEAGWNLDRYYSIGDPFYSDAANYRVQIQAPAGYTIAATGDMKSRKQEDSRVTWEFNALAVRDFAWLAGNKYQTASKQVGRTRVTSYSFTPEIGEKALDYAAESLAYFNEAFGEYPYTQFGVVESDFYIGGMEYPNLIMLDHSLYKEMGDDYLELVTVHETAHQWWYGLVGNNQIRDAWLDEGLAEYSTLLYYGHRYGQEKAEEMYKSLIGEGKYKYLEWYMLSDDMDETIHRPSYEFTDWVIYDLLVYGKGAMLFHSLRQEMGEELFFKGLQSYFQENRFQNAGKADIIRTFNQVSGRDWQHHFDQWLYDGV
jgi:hypothetical protein